MQAHSLSSRGKARARSSASSSSSTLTASSSDVSIKRYTNSLNNNNDTASDIVTAAPSIITEETQQQQANVGSGLYREPRLNKSDSASLSQHQMLNGRCQGSNVMPLSPNSIDNRWWVFFQHFLHGHWVITKCHLQIACHPDQHQSRSAKQQ